MSILVHLVGDADLGIPTDGPDRQGVVERLQLRHDRIDQLSRADPVDRRDLACNFSWTDGGPCTQAVAPLASVLQAQPGITKILLVATSSRGPSPAPGTAQPPARPENLDTEPIADALVALLDAEPDLYGPAVQVVRVLLAGLAEEQSLGPMVAALGEELDPGQTVFLVWGSGATALATAAVAAAIEHAADWHLIDPKSGERIDLGRSPAGMDPQVAWLLRLGYPWPLVTQPGRLGLDEQQQDGIKRLSRRLNLADPHATRSAALAELICADLRRNDGSAALAVRSLIVAHYRSIRRDSETDRFAVRPDQPLPTLGKAIEAAHTHPRDTEADRFLRTDLVADLNRAASDASHTLRPLTPESRDQVKTLVAMEPDLLRDELADIGLPVAPSVPTGQVVAVLPVGLPVGDRPFIGFRLIRDGVGDDVLRYLGLRHAAPGSVDLHLLLVPTAETSKLAASLQHGLRTAPDRHPTLRQVNALPVPDVDPTRPSAVRRATAACFAGVDGDAEALLLVPTGDKRVVIGTLLASIDRSRGLGIPVFLPQLLTSGPAAPGPGQHQLAGLLATDEQLLHVAERAMARLDLDTASRLLAAGSRELQRLSRDVEQLANAVRQDADAVSDWPASLDGVRRKGGLELLSARVELAWHVAECYGSQYSAADRTRLLHVTWQLVEISDPRLRPQGTTGPGRPRPELDLHERPGNLTDGAWAERWRERRQIEWFRRLRNQLPTAHGDSDDALGVLISRVTNGRLKETSTAKNMLKRLSRAVCRVGFYGWPERPEPDQRLVELHRLLYVRIADLRRRTRERVQATG